MGVVEVPAGVCKWLDLTCNEAFEENGPATTKFGGGAMVGLVQHASITGLRREVLTAQKTLPEGEALCGPVRKSDLRKKKHGLRVERRRERITTDSRHNAKPRDCHPDNEAQGSNAISSSTGSKELSFIASETSPS